MKDQEVSTFGHSNKRALRAAITAAVMLCGVTGEVYAWDDYLDDSFVRSSIHRREISTNQADIRTASRLVELPSFSALQATRFLSTPKEAPVPPSRYLAADQLHVGAATNRVIDQEIDQEIRAVTRMLPDLEGAWSHQMMVSNLKSAARSGLALAGGALGVSSGGLFGAVSGSIAVGAELGRTFGRDDQRTTRRALDTIDKMNSSVGLTTSVFKGDLPSLIVIGATRIADQTILHDSLNRYAPTKAEISAPLTRSWYDPYYQYTMTGTANIKTHFTPDPDRTSIHDFHRGTTRTVKKIAVTTTQRARDLDKIAMPAAVTLPSFEHTLPSIHTPSPIRFKAYDFSPPSKAYDFSPPSKAYDFSPPSKVYDFSPPSKAYDFSPPSKAYDLDLPPQPRIPNYP